MFEKYDAYKDSGVDWLGEIPSNWEIKRLKAPLAERNEKNDPIKTDFILSLTMHQGVIPQSEKTGGGNKPKEDLTAYKLARPYDIVLNSMNVIVGSVGLSKYFGVVSPVYYMLYARDGSKTNISYYNYIFQSQAFQRNLGRLGTGILIKKSESSGKLNTIRMKISMEDLNNELLPIPSLSEQNKIVDFLNRKTFEIDQAIAIKEQQITLLNERKQIVIQKAVTQGLDPNVPMKDSGVEWMGKIPEHWEVKKIKYATKIFRGKFTHRPRNDPSLYDGKYPFFQTGDVAKAGKFLVDFKQTLNEKGLRISTLIPKGTVVITIAANIGDVSILGVDACFPDSIVGFQPTELLDRDFLFYSLLSMKNQFVNSSIKNTQMNLNVDRIGSNYICVCPKGEQINIVQKIEEFDVNFANAIDLLNREIEKLKEYKTTLINDAVTGKIKVA